MFWSFQDTNQNYDSKRTDRIYIWKENLENSSAHFPVSIQLSHPAKNLHKSLYTYIK